jgi:hypothetical protein
LNEFDRHTTGSRDHKRDWPIIVESAAQRLTKNGHVPFLPARFLLLALIGVAPLLSLLAPSLVAQRVQFPTPAQPVQVTTPYTVPGTTAPPPTYVSPVSPPPAVTSPYTVPSTSPPAAVVSPYPTTPFSPPPAIGPPPTFDPYAVGGSVAPPPPAIPYTPPTPVPTLPPPGVPPVAPPPLVPGPPPYQPAPYDITTSGEGYWAKTQKLLQELSFEYTFLFGRSSHPNEFGMNRAEVSSTFAFPMFYNIETPLLVTPGFAVDWLDGPFSGPPIPGPPPMAGGPDLPPRLYDAYLDFAWYPRCYEWLGGELGFRTGVYSDFDNVNSDSLRFMGRGLASVGVAPNLDILFGAVYLDRVDVKILPAGGVYYRPTPDWDLYLVFPNPKVRRFLTAIGNTKWYGYAAGEYGGGSWTVARQTTDDRIDYNDIRLIGGLEWETQTQIRGHIEAGWVFDREIVFVSGDPPNFKPNDTIMLRAGVDF